MNLNSVTLAGNLTRDPELKTAGQTQVCNFSVAVNRKWKDASGVEKEEVYFGDCTAFGRTAEAIAKYLRKGRGIYVQGRLSRDEWNDKTTGEKKSRTKIIVESFQFTDSRPQEAAAAAPRQESAAERLNREANSDQSGNDSGDAPF